MEILLYVLDDTLDVPSGIVKLSVAPRRRQDYIQVFAPYGGNNIPSEPLDNLRLVEI